MSTRPQSLRFQHLVCIVLAFWLAVALAQYLASKITGPVPGEPVTEGRK